MMHDEHLHGAAASLGNIPRGTAPFTRRRCRHVVPSLRYPFVARRWEADPRRAEVAGRFASR